jgi:hypothetical protein
MGRYWAKIAQISDFTGKLQLGFIMQIWGGEGVAVDGDAEPSTASGGCSEAEHPQRSKKLSKRAARRFFRAPQGGGGRCACGYLGSVSVRSTDLDFSPQKNLNSYPALQATERGSSRGNLSPLTRFCLLLAVQKEAPAGQAYSLCLCKRLRDAEGDHKLAPAG